LIVSPLEFFAIIVVENVAYCSTFNSV